VRNPDLSKAPYIARLGAPHHFSGPQGFTSMRTKDALVQKILTSKSTAQCFGIKKELSVS